MGQIKSIERFLTPEETNFIDQAIVYGELISKSHGEKKIELSRKFYSFLDGSEYATMLCAVMLLGQDIHFAVDNSFEDMTDRELKKRLFDKYKKRAAKLNKQETLIGKEKSLKTFLEKGKKFINFIVKSEIEYKTFNLETGKSEKLHEDLPF